MKTLTIIAVLSAITASARAGVTVVEVVNVNCGGHKWEPVSTMKGRANPADRGVAPVAYPGVTWSDGFGWNRDRLKNSENETTAVSYYDSRYGKLQTAANDLRPIGTGELNASLKTSVTTKPFACGRHSITARYVGDLNNSPGTTAPFILNVKPRPGNGKLKVFILSGQSNMEGQGYEIVGFGWHQGWNDRIDEGRTAEYESNLVNLIKDVRAEFKAPKMPFVVATTGMSKAKIDPSAMKLIAAQTAVSDPQKYPQFAGNVATVDTQPFDYGENSRSPGGGYHWNSNGESYFHVGEHMGLAMMKMITD